jgi:hypothetical protein
MFSDLTVDPRMYGSVRVFLFVNSDDRSPDVFRERIEAATQMKAVLGADPRPNCLIIDEIDGAPQVIISTVLSAAIAVVECIIEHLTSDWTFRLQIG